MHITAYHIKSQLIMSHLIAPHHIESHYITSNHIISHHITSHHITSHHIASHHITSHHITSHHIASHHITSQHITSHSHHIKSLSPERPQTRAVRLSRGLLSRERPQLRLRLFVQPFERIQLCAGFTQLHAQCRRVTRLARHMLVTRGVRVSTERATYRCRHLRDACLQLCVARERRLQLALE